MMTKLYDQIGGSETIDAPQALPKQIEATAADFQNRALAISARLRRENDELTRLDEVA
jgi:hypothetical protein